MLLFMRKRRKLFFVCLFPSFVVGFAIQKLYKMIGSSYKTMICWVIKFQVLCFRALWLKVSSKHTLLLTTQIKIKLRQRLEFKAWNIIASCHRSHPKFTNTVLWCSEKSIGTISVRDCLQVNTTEVHGTSAHCLSEALSQAKLQ